MSDLEVLETGLLAYRIGPAPFAPTHIPIPVSPASPGMMPSPTLAYTFWLDSRVLAASIVYGFYQVTDVNTPGGAPVVTQVAIPTPLPRTAIQGPFTQYTVNVSTAGLANTGAQIIVTVNAPVFGSPTDFYVGYLTAKVQ